MKERKHTRKSFSLQDCIGRPPAISVVGTYSPTRSLSISKPTAFMKAIDAYLSAVQVVAMCVHSSTSSTRMNGDIVIHIFIAMKATGNVGKNRTSCSKFLLFIKSNFIHARLPSLTTTA